MKTTTSIFILLLFITSCKKPLKDIVKETEQATFIIYTYDEYGTPNGSGSGFFIDKNGTGITNYHVLDESVKAIIKTYSGEKYEIERVVSSDKDKDIALFQIKNVKNETFNVLRFSKQKIEVGEKVYNIGSPLGLENSVSEGIVSSLRENSHGKVIQVTAPISAGCSGSPILNEKGDVIAVATYSRKDGQNLNFGVIINEEMLTLNKKNDFSKRNPKFNSNDKFVVLNISAESDPELILNAIEFGENMTTLYLSYTYMQLNSNKMFIWSELNKMDEGFLIHDLDKDKKYYLTSSTLGVNKENGTKVELASIHRFKVYFPPIRDELDNIDIIYGYDSRGWHFRNIDLKKYRDNLHVNPESYQKEYALTIMKEGYFKDANNIFLELLENNPRDYNVLNTLGVVSYVADNNNDALMYFTEAIDVNPNIPLAYINRHRVYEYQENYSKALDDINKVVQLDPSQPDNYSYRANIYYKQENWGMAKNDLDKLLEHDEFKRDPGAYLFRIHVNANLNDFASVCKDIHTAYNLTDDEELEAVLQKLWKDCNCR